MKTKICGNCKKRKSLKSFYKSGKDGKYYQRRCKQCNIDNNKTWAGRNKSKVKQYRDVWRAINKNTIKVKSQEILDNMRSHSKRKGLHVPKFIREEIQLAIENKCCAVTGIPFEFDQSRFTKSPWTPTPDRIDSSKGYTKDNAQWVCYMYNIMKSEFTSDIIVKFITTTYENLHKIK